MKTREINVANHVLILACLSVWVLFIWLLAVEGPRKVSHYAGTHGKQSAPLHRPH